MKTAFRFILVSSIVFTTQVATASELTLNAEKTTIRGAVDDSAKVDALAFYSPAISLASGKLSSECEFSKDKYSPNGAGKFVKIPVEQKQGSYSVEVAVKATRGNCEYVLDTLYLNFDSGKVYLNLALQSQAKVSSSDKMMREAGLDLIPMPSFQSLKKLSCEFVTSQPVGLCQTQEGMLPEINYRISNAPSNYTLDVSNQERD